MREGKEIYDVDEETHDSDSDSEDDDIEVFDGFAAGINNNHDSWIEAL